MSSSPDNVIKRKIMELVQYLCFFDTVAVQIHFMAPLLSFSAITN